MHDRLPVLIYCARACSQALTKTRGQTKRLADAMNMDDEAAEAERLQNMDTNFHKALEVEGC
eukprot:929895-Prymnesium_polylepis.1